MQDTNTIITVIKFHGNTPVEIKTPIVFTEFTDGLGFIQEEYDDEPNWECEYHNHVNNGAVDQVALFHNIDMPIEYHKVYIVEQGVNKEPLLTSMDFFRNDTSLSQI